MKMRLSLSWRLSWRLPGCGNPPRSRPNPGRPVDIGSRLELFVVHYLIDRLEGARLVLGPPPAGGNRPEGDRPWEGSFNFGYEVIRDGGRLSHVSTGDGQKADRGVVCYAESRDGVHWEKPNLRLVDVGGTRENNVMALVDGTGRRPLGHIYPFIDSGPECRPPSA